MRKINYFIFILATQWLTIYIVGLVGFSLKKDWINDLLPSVDSQVNGTKRNPIFSCLEDEGYEAVSNYVNCHLFCPSCNQGFGKCISARDQKLCICECQYPVQLHKECRSIQRYCRTEVQSDTDKTMKRCKEACTQQGFSDGALCGGFNEPPIVRPTCICLCPQIPL